jgi:hypothetical protein
MRCILLGGSGQVGGAVARALVESDVCSHLTLVGRRSIGEMEGVAEVEQVVTDTSADDFEEVVKQAAQGHDVGISCIGIGSGSMTRSEESMLAVEVGVFGSFARGCKAAGIESFELLTAVGIDEKSAHSMIKYSRVIGRKYQTALEIGFEKLAVFKPGVIVGNEHTPGWITHFTGLLPDSSSWGNIHQDEIGAAFVAHLQKRLAGQTERVVSYGNKEMKQLIAG